MLYCLSALWTMLSMLMGDAVYHHSFDFGGMTEPLVQVVTNAGT
jgi:hypothetical protein